MEDFEHRTDTKKKLLEIYFDRVYKRQEIGNSLSQ